MTGQPGFREGGDGAEELRNVNIGELVDEAEKHNDPASQLRSWPPSYDEAQQIVNPVIPPATLEDLQEKYELTLGRIGLAFEEDSSGGAILSLDPRPIRITLENAEKFISYLAALTPKGITPDQVRGLVYITNDFIRRISWDLTPETQQGLFVDIYSNRHDFLENLRKLDPEKTHGLDKAATTLEKILEAAQGGFLKEYLFIDNKSLLSGPGEEGFGPAKWHTDSTEATYQENWDTALQTVQLLSGKPAAETLRAQLIANLKASIEHAQKAMQATIGSEDENRSAYKLSVLREAKEKLEKA